jgi:hypothetical protein
MKRTLLIVALLAACNGESLFEPIPTPPAVVPLVEPTRPSERLPLALPGTCVPGVWICYDDWGPGNGVIVDSFPQWGNK